MNEPYGCGHFWDNYRRRPFRNERTNMIRCKGGFEVKVGVAPDGDVTLSIRDADREMASVKIDPDHAAALARVIEGYVAEGNKRKVEP